MLGSREDIWTFSADSKSFMCYLRCAIIATNPQSHRDSGLVDLPAISTFWLRVVCFVGGLRKREAAMEDLLAPEIYVEESRN